jgi:uncharacterized protein (DUF2384 family)
LHPRAPGEDGAMTSDAPPDPLPVTAAEVAAVLGCPADAFAASGLPHGRLPLACLDAAVAGGILAPEERRLVRGFARRLLMASAPLSRREGARLARLVRVTLLARRLLPVPETAGAWLREMRMGRHAPLHLARSARGAEQVETFLWQQFAGVYL